MISVNPWKLNEESEVTTCTHSIRVLQNRRFSKTKPNNYIASNQPCLKLLLNPITICNTQPIHIIEDSETTIYINMNEFFNQYKLIIRPTLRPFKNTGKKKKKKPLNRYYLHYETHWYLQYFLTKPVEFEIPKSIENLIEDI